MVWEEIGIRLLTPVFLLLLNETHLGTDRLAAGVAVEPSLDEIQESKSRDQRKLTGIKSGRSGVLKPRPREAYLYKQALISGHRP